MPHFGIATLVCNQAVHHVFGTSKGALFMFSACVYGSSCLCSQWKNHGKPWRNMGKLWKTTSFLANLPISGCLCCRSRKMCSMFHVFTALQYHLVSSSNQPHCCWLVCFFPISKVLNPYMKSPLKPCTGRGRKLRLGPSGSSALPAGELGRSMVLGAVRSHWGFMRCNPFEEGLCGNESLDG